MRYTAMGHRISYPVSRPPLKRSEGHELENQFYLYVEIIDERSTIHVIFARDIVESKDSWKDQQQSCGDIKFAIH